ncbi:MAG: cache domain-containing protein, partial [Pseudoruegeria sp.]
MTRKALAVFAFIIAVVGFSGSVWWVGFSAALKPIAEQGRADLSLASGRLTSGLQQFRQAAVLLADHPELIRRIQDPELAEQANAVLLETSDKLGTLEIQLADASGKILASSNPRGSANISLTPYFSRAMQGAVGSYHAQVDASGQRVFYFSAPLLDGGPPFGAVIVKVDMEAVEESDWRGGAQAIYFVDASGVVFVSNRSELLLRTRGTTASSTSYFTDQLKPFFSYQDYNIAGHDLWAVDAGRYIPIRALHMTQPLP